MPKRKIVKNLVSKAFGKDSPLKKILISKGMPLLANVLTGGAAGKVIGIVKNITGIESDDPSELEKALVEKPEVVERLKEFEQNQRIELEKLSLQAAQIELEKTKTIIGDVQDARSREIEITKVTGKRDRLMVGLAITVIVCFFGLVAYAIYKPENIKDSGALNQLFGAMVAGFSMVLSYFFGSSKGSADKNDTIAKHIKGSNIGSAQDFNNAKG